MADQSLGDYFVTNLLPDNAGQFAAPPVQQPQWSMPQLAIRDNGPGMPPQFSGGVTVPTQFGDLSLSGQATPSKQYALPDWGVRLGLVRRF